MITIGLEEEVQVVDDNGQLVTHDLDRDFAQYASAEGMLDREIHRCVIELKTRVCKDVDGLLTALRSLRSQARNKAAAQGQQIIVAGLHPTACWQQQALHEGATYPHYDRLLDEYQDVARSAVTFGMHVHIGLDFSEPKLAIMNRLRHVLPELLALSASSPFFEGRDTGLQSWRHSLLDRYPRMGTPDPWSSEQEYRAHVQRLRRLGCVGEDQALWQDLRLHHRYGTLEVRVMDAHPDLDRIGLVVTLLKWEAETLLREIRTGHEGPVWSRACIEENKWRARRYGLHAQWIDWNRDEACGFVAHFQRWWERIAQCAQHAAERNYWERQLADALDSASFADALRERVVHDDNWHDTLQWMVAQAFEQPAQLQHAEGWQ